MGIWVAETPCSGVGGVSLKGGQFVRTVEGETAAANAIFLYNFWLIQLCGVGVGALHDWLGQKYTMPYVKSRCPQTIYPPQNITHNLRPSGFFTPPEY